MFDHIGKVCTVSEIMFFFRQSCEQLDFVEIHLLIFHGMPVVHLITFYS